VRPNGAAGAEPESMSAGFCFLFLAEKTQTSVRKII
jgi:hypothetical protein